MKKTWHAPLIEVLRRSLPSDSFIRPYAKRIVEDARSLLNTRQDWTFRETKAPATLFIETTNICNADCVFCAYQHQGRFRAGKGTMNDELFERTLASHIALVTDPGDRHINFTPLVGEPLVDPKIIQRVARCKEIGADVTFFTNGILLNRIDIEALLNTGVDRIFISTAPFDRESHELLYRTNGKYDDLLSGVQKLLTARNQRNAATRVNLMFRSHIPLTQIVQSPDFTNCILPKLKAKEVKNLYAQVRGFDSWGGQISASDLPKGMSLAQAPRLKRRPCMWTFNLMVMYDGLVRACSCRFTGSERLTTDALMIGDIRQQTLSEIWNGEMIRTLRRNFERGTLPEVCRSCTMYRLV